MKMTEVERKFEALMNEKTLMYCCLCGRARTVSWDVACAYNYEGGEKYVCSACETKFLIGRLDFDTLEKMLRTPKAKAAPQKATMLSYWERKAWEYLLTRRFVSGSGNVRHVRRD